MTTTRKPIAEFEIVDHGIQHEQYFQGCGIYMTDFDGIATGIGDNPAIIAACDEAKAANPMPEIDKRTKAAL